MRERLPAAVLKWRKSIYAAVILLSALATWLAAGLQFDNSIETWFLEDDPNLAGYKQFLERFGADELTVVALFAEDVYAPEVMAAVDRITRGAEPLEHVYRVSSLTNVNTFERAGGAVRVAPLVGSLPGSEAESKRLRQRAAKLDLLNGTLVAPDGGGTAILVELKPESNNVEDKIEFMADLRKVVEPERKSGLEIHFAGSPPIDDAFFQYSYRDMAVLMPACVVLVLLICFLVYRSITAALVPLSVVIVAMLWSHAAMYLAGADITVISGVIMALILTVGVADSIHVLSEYLRCLGKGHEKSQAIQETMRNLFVPCLFTSATTVVGLLALQVSSLRPVREFAALAAFGVAVAFVLSFTLVPPLLLHVRIGKVMRHGDGGRVVGTLVKFLARPSRRQAWLTVMAGVVVISVSGFALTYLTVGANALNYFHKGAPVRTSIEEVDRRLGGSTTVEFMLTGPKDLLKDPVLLSRLDKFSRWLESLPGVTRVISIADFLRELDRVWRRQAGGLLPDSRKLAAQYYLIMEGEEDFESLVQDNFSTARLTGRVNLSEAENFVDLLPVVEERMALLAKETGAEFRMTGFVKLMSDMEKYLLDSQIWSLVLAFVSITALMMLLLRTVRIGLFSMIPNFCPILLGLAFMVATDINLDTGTVMIGSVALGLIVDDTIHFLTRFTAAVKAGVSVEDAVASAMFETGRPIVITSLVLAGGFFIMLLGSFAPNSNFGLVSAVVILAAVVADLVLLPAALLLAGSRLHPRPKIE